MFTNIAKIRSTHVCDHGKPKQKAHHTEGEAQHHGPVAFPEQVRPLVNGCCYYGLYGGKLSKIHEIYNMSLQYQKPNVEFQTLLATDNSAWKSRSILSSHYVTHIHVCTYTHRHTHRNTQRKTHSYLNMI